MGPPAGGDGTAGPPPHGPPDPPWGDGRPSGRDAHTAMAVPFSVLEALLLVVWTLLAQFLVALPALRLGLVTLDDGAGLVSLALAAQAVGLAGVLAWLAGRGRLSWRLLGPVRPRWGHVGAGVLVGVAGFLTVTLALALLLALLGPVEPPQQALLEALTRGGATTVLVVVAAVVMAPVVEEVVFRGLLFQALHRRVGLWPAALLSAAFFTAVHVEVTQPLYSGGLLALGVLFALTLARTGSLIVPIVAHAVYNAITVTLALGAERTAGS